MNCSKFLTFIPLAAVALLFTAEAAHAQLSSPKIVITNTNPTAEIALDSSSSVEFAANGDLQVRCRQSGGNCLLQNLGSTGGGTNPPTGLSLTPSVTALTAGAPFNLTWGSVGAEACFGAGPTSPSVSGWTGRVLATSQGGAGLALTLAEGTYNFQMRCYNATGSQIVNATPVVVSASTGGGTGAGYCGEYYNGTTRPVPTDPRFTAHNFTRGDATFVGIWGTQPGVGGGPAVALPGNFLDPSFGRYLAVPITLSGSATQVTFQWIDSQGSGIPTGQVSVTISPCPGDFRPRQFPNTTGDDYLSIACGSSQTGISGNLSATSQSGQAGCLAPTGKQLFLNIATHNMYLPTAPTTSTCGGASTCGVNMQVQ